MLKMWNKIYTTSLFTSYGCKTTYFILITNPKLKNQQDRTPYRSVWTAMRYSSGTPICDAKKCYTSSGPIPLGACCLLGRDEMGDLGWGQQGDLAPDQGGGLHQGHSWLLGKRAKLIITVRDLGNWYYQYYLFITFSSTLNAWRIHLAFFLCLRL